MCVRKQSSRGWEDARPLLRLGKCPAWPLPLGTHCHFTQTVQAFEVAVVWTQAHTATFAQATGSLLSLKQKVFFNYGSILTSLAIVLLGFCLHYMQVIEPDTVVRTYNPSIWKWWGGNTVLGQKNEESKQRERGGII